MSIPAPSVLSRPHDFRPFNPTTPSPISSGITYGMPPAETETRRGFTPTALPDIGSIATPLTTYVAFTATPFPTHVGFAATPLTTYVGFGATPLADIKQIFDAIQALYLSSNTPRDRQIADRITVLYRDAIAEDEYILPASLTQFAAFFLAQPWLGLPKVTLTPDGTLRARWIGGPRNFVAIEFTGEPLAKLVAEIPREDNLTAAHFSSEPLKNILSVARAISASFT